MKLAFYAAQTPDAQGALERLKKKYDQHPIEDADVLIALGGDGSLLHALHETFDHPIPVFGMNRGSVGFLLNAYEEDNLITRLKKAEAYHLHPLRMDVDCINGENFQYHAVNEVALLRQTHQAARLKISIDGIERMSELICDGIMVATPAGSTAYNFSAHGPIIPLDSDILALTPISAFRPRRWRGALLPHTSEIVIEISEAEDRPVAATADFHEIRNVRKVTIIEDRKKNLTLLYDPDMNLHERIRKEQFMP